MVPYRRLTARAPTALRCLVPAGLVAFLSLFAVVRGEAPPAPTGPSLEKMKELVRQLGDDDYCVREDASKLLQAIGDPALPLLENASDSPDPEVRHRAWRIIEEHATRGNVGALLFQLSSSNAPLRASAAESLGKLESKAQNALPSLIKATSDQADFVRCSAQEAVKKIQATLPVRLEVKNNADAIEINGATFFRIEVSNQGKAAASEVCILAYLPDHLELTSVQGQVKHRKEGRQIICEPFALAGNESRFCEIHVKGQKAGSIQLKVEVKSKDLEAPLLGEGNLTINAANGQ